GFANEAKRCGSFRTVHLCCESHVQLIIPQPCSNDGDTTVIAVTTEVHSRAACERVLGHVRERLSMARYGRFEAESQISTGIANLEVQDAIHIRRNDSKRSQLILKAALGQ